MKIGKKLALLLSVVLLFGLPETVRAEEMNGETDLQISASEVPDVSKYVYDNRFSDLVEELSMELSDPSTPGEFGGSTYHKDGLTIEYGDIAGKTLFSCACADGTASVFGLLYGDSYQHVKDSMRTEGWYLYSEVSNKSLVYFDVEGEQNYLQFSFADDQTVNSWYLNNWAEGDFRPAPIYRLYSPVNGEHLYTTDANEVRVLVTRHSWRYEGVSWFAPTSGTPVYRLYNSGLQSHLYTTDENEVNVLTTQHGWTMDNNGEPLFFSGGSTPIYRLYNRELRGLHLWTTDGNEYNVLPGHGWKQEGTVMYGQSSGDPTYPMP